MDKLVATTVNPGMTAPLGSVTTPEIEPVMAAHVVTVPRSAPKRKPSLINRAMAVRPFKMNATETILASWLRERNRWGAIVIVRSDGVNGRFPPRNGKASSNLSQLEDTQMEELLVSSIDQGSHFGRRRHLDEFRDGVRID